MSQHPTCSIGVFCDTSPLFSPQPQPGRILCCKSSGRPIALERSNRVPKAGKEIANGFLYPAGKVCYTAVSWDEMRSAHPNLNRWRCGYARQGDQARDAGNIQILSHLRVPGWISFFFYEGRRGNQMAIHMPVMP